MERDFAVNAVLWMAECQNRCGKRPLFRGENWKVLTLMIERSLMLLPQRTQRPPRGKLEIAVKLHARWIGQTAGPSALFGSSWGPDTQFFSAFSLGYANGQPVGPEKQLLIFAQVE